MANKVTSADGVWRVQFVYVAHSPAAAEFLRSLRHEALGIYDAGYTQLS